MQTQQRYLEGFCESFHREFDNVDRTNPYILSWTIASAAISDRTEDRSCVRTRFRRRTPLFSVVSECLALKKIPVNFTAHELSALEHLYTSMARCLDAGSGAMRDVLSVRVVLLRESTLGATEDKEEEEEEDAKRSPLVLSQSDNQRCLMAADDAAVVRLELRPVSL